MKNKLSLLIVSFLGLPVILFAQDPVSLMISPDNVELRQWEPALLKAILTYSDGSTKEVAADWYISDKQGCEVVFYLPQKHEVIGNLEIEFNYEIFGQPLVGVTVAKENQGKKVGWVTITAKFDRFTASATVIDAATLIWMSAPAGPLGYNIPGTITYPYSDPDGADNDGYSIPTPFLGHYDDPTSDINTVGPVVLSSVSVDNPAVISIKIYTIYCLIDGNQRLKEIWYEVNGKYYNTYKQAEPYDPLPHDSLSPLPDPDYVWKAGSGMGFRILQPGTALVNWKAGGWNDTMNVLFR